MQPRSINGLTEQFDETRSIGAALGKHCVLNLSNDDNNHDDDKTDKKLDQCARCETAFHLNITENAKQLLLDPSGKEIYVQEGLSMHFSIVNPCSMFTNNSDKSQCHERFLSCNESNADSHPDFRICIAESCGTHFNASCETSETNCCDRFVETYDKFHEVTQNYPIQYYYTKHSCEANKCKCANGSPVKSSDCFIHAEEKCESCDVGYHVSTGSCVLNRCECAHGSAVVGTDCLQNGSTSCKNSSCDEGYHSELLGDDKGYDCEPNKCTCTFGNAFEHTSCLKHGNVFCVPNSCQDQGRFCM